MFNDRVVNALSIHLEQASSVIDSDVRITVVKSSPDYRDKYDIEGSYPQLYDNSVKVEVVEFFNSKEFALSRRSFSDNERVLRITIPSPFKSEGTEVYEIPTLFLVKTHRVGPSRSTPNTSHLKERSEIFFDSNEGVIIIDFSECLPRPLDITPPPNHQKDIEQANAAFRKRLPVRVGENTPLPVPALPVGSGTPLPPPPVAINVPTPKGPSNFRWSEGEE